MQVTCRAEKRIMTNASILANHCTNSHDGTFAEQNAASKHGAWAYGGEVGKLTLMVDDRARVDHNTRPQHDTASDHGSCHDDRPGTDND